MTSTNLVTGGTVWIAPPGTSLDDASEWMHLGYVDHVTFEADDAPDVYQLEAWPVKATTTIAVPLYFIRHIRPPTSSQCEWTVRAIEKHAQWERITAALTEALASGLLPCPAPFPARAARRPSPPRPYARPPHF